MRSLKAPYSHRFLFSFGVGSIGKKPSPGPRRYDSFIFGGDLLLYSLMYMELFIVLLFTHHFQSITKFLTVSFAVSVN